MYICIFIFWSHPIPQFIFEFQLFRHSLDLLLELAAFNECTPAVKLQEIKRLQREAARLTRNGLTHARVPCRAAALTTC
eukprot:7720314-Pyramimonas_sp.AAC.1